MSHTQDTPESQQEEFLPTFLSEAQLAFLEEIHFRGGSLIATAFAYQVPVADLARSASVLGLVCIQRLLDYDSHGMSNPDLPAEIALEDVVFALREETDDEIVLGDLKLIDMGLAKLKREESWTVEGCQAFLSVAERLFAVYRSQDTTGGRLPAAGIDAAKRTAAKIFRENPSVLFQLREAADRTVERYFDHLSQRELDCGEFGIFTVARGEGKSPAWTCGKLLAGGLIHPANRALDPLLSTELQDTCQRDASDTAKSLATRYAAECLSELRAASLRGVTRFHEARLRIAAAENDLADLKQGRAAPHRIMPILDQLDRAVEDASLASDDLRVLSFAAHSRVFQDNVVAQLGDIQAPDPAGRG